MTDDRYGNRYGEGRGEDEFGALLGGLLDGLPESGRGTGPSVPANPFQTSEGFEGSENPELPAPVDAPQSAGPPPVAPAPDADVVPAPPDLTAPVGPEISEVPPAPETPAQQPGSTGGGGNGTPEVPGGGYTGPTWAAPSTGRQFPGTDVPTGPPATGHPVAGDHPAPNPQPAPTGRPASGGRSAPAGHPVPGVRPYPAPSARPVHDDHSVPDGHPEPSARPAPGGSAVSAGHPAPEAQPAPGGPPVLDGHAAAAQPEPDGHAEPANHPAPEEVRTAQDNGKALTDADREALYRVISERRDVSGGFLPDPVAHDRLIRVLEAAHRAPSIGGAEPWDFLVIDDRALRTRVHEFVRAEHEKTEHEEPEHGRHALPPSDAGSQAPPGLEADAVLRAPLNIAVTVDPTRGPDQVPGCHNRPTEAAYSVALAVENLWLAAHAEGLGVGWLPFSDERGLASTLDLPPHLEVVAYLCVGRVEETHHGLKEAAQRRPLSQVVHHDRYGRRGLPGQTPTGPLEETIAAIGTPDAAAMERAEDRQSRMTKPRGSLGALEDVGVRLAGLTGECPPPVPEPAAVAVFAGDHGVHVQGVTPWPQEVTAQMVCNFLAGGAVVNAFAEQVGAEVTVVDVGVVADLPSAPGLLSRKVARGTSDPTQGPAMTRQQAIQAMEAGIEVARDLVAAGNRCLVTGDMGVANTTPSAALICAYTGAAPEQATGTGAGADEQTHRRKIDVVRRVLAANPVDPADPLGTLAALGGLEHAALAGFVLSGAAMRVPVLLDGVIAGSSALAAAALAPGVVGACFAGHRSAEAGHALTLEHLGLEPMVDLEMRLGEGSGALLGLPLLQASARLFHSVATFEDAGVSTVR